MQKIIIKLTAANGVVTEKALVKPEGKPLQLTVPADTQVSVQVQGAVSKTPDSSASPAPKRDLAVKRVGKNLVIEGEGEQLVEVTDYYETPNVSMGSVEWDYSGAIPQAGGATLEAQAASDHASVGLSGTGAPAALNIPFVAGVVGAFALSGGGAAAALVSNTVSGVITAGPVATGHGLSVVMYKGDGTPVNGTVAASTATVDAAGKFSMNVGSYTGVVKAVVKDGNTTPDYKDEATGLDVNLNAVLMAVGVVSGATLKLNINPLTTIASIKAGASATDGSGAIASTTAANDANAAVAKAFGLTDITATDPDTTNDGTTTTNAIGAVLAALSGMDLANDGNAQTTITALAGDLTRPGSTGTLSAVQQAALLVGAQQADPTGTQGLVNKLSDALTAAASVTGFSVGDVATDNIIKAGELVGGTSTLTGTVASGVAQGDIHIFVGTTELTGGTLTVTGTSWSYTLTGANVTSLTQAEGAVALSLKVGTTGATATEKASRVVVVDVVDDAPTGVTFVNTTRTLLETADITAGKKLAEIVIADADGYNGGTPTVSDTINFEVRTVSGKYELWLKSTAASIDYETVSGHALTTTVTAGGTVSQTFTLSLTDVNEAPTGTTTTLTINEDTPRTLTAADFGFADAPGETNTLSAVIITTLPTAGTLKLNGVAVTLNQSIAVTDLPNLVFAPAANANGNAYATIGFKVQDNGGTANGGVNTSVAANTTLTFNVTAVNDAPVNTVPAAQTVNEDTNLAITGLSVADVDAGSSNITVTLSVLHGTITVAAATGVTLDTNGTASVTLTGTLAAINSALAASNGVVYRGVLNYNGADTLTMLTSDGSNTGTGGALTDSDTVAITVTPVNDAPTASATAINAQTAVKNLSAWTLDMSGYFSDVDASDVSSTETRTYSIVGRALPDGLHLNTSSGLIDGTPTGTTDASDTYTVRMTDRGGLYADKTFSLQVVDKPMVTGFTVSDSSATAPNTASIGKSGEALTFVVSFNQAVDVSAGATITFTMNGQNVTGTCSAGVSNSLTANFTGTVPATGNGTAVGISDLASGTIAAPAANGGQTLLTTNFGSLSYSGYTVDNTPPTITTTTLSAAENGTAVGTVLGNDNQAITWSIDGTGADDAKFRITSAGVLSFAATKNYEAPDDADANGIYVVKVKATDAAGNVSTQNINVTLTDVNEAPTAVALNNAVPPLAENTATTTRTKVADIAITDDALGSNAITLTGADVSAFEVDGTVLYLKAGVNLDYETKARYDVTVNVADSTVTGSSPVTANYSLALTNVNEAPVFNTNSHRYIFLAREGTGAYLKASEIEVWSNGVNIAPGKTIIDYVGEDSRTRLTDGTFRSDYSSGGGIGFQWVQIDLGQSYPIDAVKFYGAYDGSAAGDSNHIAILTSNTDLSTKTSLADATQTPGTALLGFTNGSDSTEAQAFYGNNIAFILTDTAAKDSFANRTGTLGGHDVDSATLTYGITDGTTGGTTTIDSVTYDVSKVGTYGTLYVKSADGRYVYMPNAAAINALTANQTENFTVTVTDNATAPLTGTATLTVNVTGADDAPTLVSSFVTHPTPTTGDSDYLQVIVGQALPSLGLAALYQDVDTSDAAPTFQLVSVDGAAATDSTFRGITVNADGTVTGTPLEDTSAIYPKDYSVVIRAKDASNPSLYLDHTYLLHVLKAPMVQSFTVADNNAGGGTDAAIGKSGDTLTFSVVFSEDVTVDTTGGTPAIDFTLGGNTVTASYNGGTGSNTLSFVATSTTGNATSATLSSVNLNGGTVTGVQSHTGWATTTVNQTASYTLDNTPPTLGNASYNVAESIGTSMPSNVAVATLVGSDTTALTYALGSTGVDNSFFTLSSAGALTLNTGKSFEDTATHANTYSLTVDITDAAGNLLDEKAITVNLTDVNEAPVVSTPLADFTVYKSEAMASSQTVSFSDPDTSAGFRNLFYTMSGAPAGLVIDSGTGAISGTTNATNDTYNVTVTAWDGGAANLGLSASDDFVVTVAKRPALAATQTLDGITNLDVKSKIVVAFDESITLGSGVASTIKIYDDSGSSAWAYTNADTGETKRNTFDNDIVISLDGTGTVTGFTVGGVDLMAKPGMSAKLSSMLAVSGGSKLVINAGGDDALSATDWDFDFDFGANYHVELSAGVVKSSTTGALNGLIDGTSSLNFTTVTPVANNTGAASQKMADDGTLSSSYIWHSTAVSRSTSAAVDFAFGTGSHAAVIGLSQTAGVNMAATASNVNLNGFGVDDLLYHDNLGNMTYFTTDGTETSIKWSSGDRYLGNAGSTNGSSWTRFDITVPVLPVMDAQLEGTTFLNTNAIIFG